MSAGPRSARAGLSLAVVSLAVVVGCAAPERQRSAAPASPAGAGSGARIWQYPASDFQAMCIVMQSDGSLRFVGGFTFFAPGTWRVDPASGLTALTLGGSGAFPGRVGSVSAAVPAAPGADAPPAVVLRSDPAQRRIDYRIDAGTPAIEFAGFVFFRAPTCSAGR